MIIIDFFVMDYNCELLFDNLKNQNQEIWGVKKPNLLVLYFTRSMDNNRKEELW